MLHLILEEIYVVVICYNRLDEAILTIKPLHIFIGVIKKKKSFITHLARLCWDSKRLFLFNDKILGMSVHGCKHISLTCLYVMQYFSDLERHLLNDN